MRSVANISSINLILQIVIILNYYFAAKRQSRTPGSIHWCHSQGNRRWRLAVQAISYMQLILISEQNQNCFDPHAPLIHCLGFVRPSVHWSVGPSVRPSVYPSVSTSQKVGKRAYPPLPTRPQLMAVYPALLFADTQLYRGFIFPCIGLCVGPLVHGD